MHRELTADTRTGANSILSQLRTFEAEPLWRALAPVELSARTVLYEPGSPIRYAYFLESGMISIVSLMSDGRSIEVGTIGREGVVGGVVLLGPCISPFRYLVQIAGGGYRIEINRLLELVPLNTVLRNCILRYQESLLTQSMQCVACNGLHSVVQRCSRWLLTARDRVDSDDLEITHEFLALMLGVRRASISEVLGPLQQQGLVRCNRGAITILDRAALEAAACECYGVIARKLQLRNAPAAQQDD